MMKVDMLLKDIEKSKGKPSGWPKCFNYDFIKGIVKISLTKKCDNKNLRQIDPWGLAFVKEVEQKTSCKVNKIIFSINNFENQTEKSSKCSKYYLESFLRRLSFLNFNNSQI